MKLLNILTPCFCHNAKSYNAENLSEETGWDRVKRMYSKTDSGLLSPEMFYIVQNSYMIAGITAFFGGIVGMLKAKDDYFRRNVASTFESQHLARRRLTDTMSLSAIKVGLYSGLKYGSFGSLYLLSAVTIANYNNKITVWEHLGTGAFMGALFRFNYGLKGMAAGASVGGVLGAFAGGIIVLNLWLFNVTLDDIREHQASSYYEMRSQRAKWAHEKQTRQN